MVVRVKIELTTNCEPKSKGVVAIENIKEFTEEHLSEESTNPTPHSEDIVQYPRFLSATTVMGNQVINLGRDELGTITDIIFDVPLSQISYAIISYGGFLGIGEKLFAVPWRAMVLDPEQRAFILNISREIFENSAGIDKNNWPDFSDRVWGEQLHQFYGVLPYWEMSPVE